MPTQPRLPEDEAPFDEATLEAFLRSISTDMVLVGGQALAFWMDRYDIGSAGAAISNDGDALGDVRTARALAERLRANLVLPDATALTSLVAQLRIPVEGGKVRNVDVLHLLYTIGGLKKSNEFTRKVRRNAVQVELEPGLELRVMHPVDLLESRTHNAVGLVDEKGGHVVTQAMWAIEVARQALVRIAKEPSQDAARVGVHVQRIFRLWRSGVGQRLWKEHGLCVLDAVDIPALREARPEMGSHLAIFEVERQTKLLERSVPS